MKKIILICFIIASQVVSLFAVETVGSTTGDTDFDKVGASGAQFLKIGVGARANAMGGAYGSIANDLSALHYNPAGINNIKNFSAMFSNSTWFADYTLNFAAVSIPISDQYKLGFNFHSFGVDGVPITTVNKPEGTGSHYSVNDYSFGLTFAADLTDQFSFGITSRLIQNAFHDVEAMGVGFDIGTIYKTGIWDLVVGFSIHNMGTEQAYSGASLDGTTQHTSSGSTNENWADNNRPINVETPSTPFALPLVFRTSLAKKFEIDDDNNLLIVTDFVTNSDSPEQFIGGAEYNWTFLSFRAGYRHGNGQFGLSGGFGFNYDMDGTIAKIDYSINPSDNLGLINRITIILDME